MEIIVRKPTEAERCEMGVCPIWEKEVSEFPGHYDESDTCLVTEGEVEIETADGNVSFAAGDLVIFPEGLDCVWRVKQPLRKHYKFG